LLRVIREPCTLYKVPESKLRKYATLKAEKEKKVFKRPPDKYIDWKYVPEFDFKFKMVEKALLDPVNSLGE
jgi:hypothetical protein